MTAYCNPLPVSLADPFALFHEGAYYIYATSLGHGFLCWTSSDLVNWQVRKPALERREDGWGQGHFWAPEVVLHQGHFLMHYSAFHTPEGMRRICVARADSPLGPFIDVKAPMFDWGTSCIDAHVFHDEDGKGYLYYVEEFPNRIFVARLTEDLTDLAEKPVLCLEPDWGWEGRVNEGPTVLRRGNRYFMLFSGNGFTSPNYGVGFATSLSPIGPWRKYDGNPILRKTSQVSGPGHGSVISSPDARELFYVYHTQQQTGSGARQLALDRLRFEKGPGEDEILVIEGPTTSPQTLPSGAPGFGLARDDSFDGRDLDRTRWIVFNEDPDLWELRENSLVITTSNTDIHRERADLKNLFLQHAPEGDFDVAVRVRFCPEQNFEQAFLCVYQDHNHFVRLSRIHADGNKFEVAQEVAGDYLSEMVHAPVGEANWLRIEKRGYTYQCFTSPDGQAWSEAGKPLRHRYQGLRVGCGAASPGSGRALEALFEEFRFESR